MNQELKKMLDENPDMKKALRETLDEMQEPVNRKKMVDDPEYFLKRLKEIYNESYCRKGETE